MSPEHQQLYRARYRLYRHHGMNVVTAYRAIRIRVAELINGCQPAQIPAEVMEFIHSLHGNH